MKRKLMFLFGGVFTAMVVLALISFTQSDERAVRKQLHEVIRDCEKTAQKGALRRLAAAGDVRHYFTSDAVIEYGQTAPMSISPSQAPAILTRIHSQVDSLTIKLDGVEFLPRKASDSLDMRAAVEVIALRGPEEMRSVDEYRLRWQKVDGTWLIRSVATDSTIRPSDW